jgi:hypothetical protein
VKTLALFLALALIGACGGQKKTTGGTTPNNKTGSATTDNKMEGTGDKKPDGAGDKKPEGDADPCAVPPP